MQERIEIRDGKEYRVKVLPEAVPHPKRSHKSRYRLNEVGKQAADQPAAKSHQAGYVPKARRDPGPSPFAPTKFPFAATINGRPVIVWPDWIEHEEAD